ncbi:MAG: hypothetical protein JNK16_09550 [Phycisphaerales bacterium]|nr:hypothetical protein [Phycisphaerales bacterium]
MDSSSPQAVSAVPVGSTWGAKRNLVRVLWMLAGRTLFRLSMERADGFRCWLLRRFGAKIGRNVRVARSCLIDIPWTLDIGDGVQIGDRAILYALGPIRIGEGSRIGRFAHICAGSHDYTKRTFDLTRPPITIGRDCTIGPDAFVGPGLIVGDRAVIEARACLFKSADAGRVYAGNPAKPVEDGALAAGGARS